MPLAFYRPLVLFGLLSTLTNLHALVIPRTVNSLKGFGTVAPHPSSVFYTDGKGSATYIAGPALWAQCHKEGQDLWNDLEKPSVHADMVTRADVEKKFQDSYSTTSKRTLLKASTGVEVLQRSVLQSGVKELQTFGARISMDDPVSETTVTTNAHPDTKYHLLINPKGTFIVCLDTNTAKDQADHTQLRLSDILFLELKKEAPGVTADQLKYVIQAGISDSQTQLVIGAAYTKKHIKPSNIWTQWKRSENEELFDAMEGTHNGGAVSYLQKDYHIGRNVQLLFTSFESGMWSMMQILGDAPGRK